MKEFNWSECFENNSTRKIIPDIERANSLIETAIERINLIKDINDNH